MQLLEALAVVPAPTLLAASRNLQAFLPAPGSIVLPAQQQPQQPAAAPQPPQAQPQQQQADQARVVLSALEDDNLLTEAETDRAVRELQHSELGPARRFLIANFATNPAKLAKELRRDWRLARDAVA